MPKRFTPTTSANQAQHCVHTNSKDACTVAKRTSVAHLASAPDPAPTPTCTDANACAPTVGQVNLNGRARRIEDVQAIGKMAMNRTQRTSAQITQNRDQDGKMYPVCSTIQPKVESHAADRVCKTAHASQKIVPAATWHALRPAWGTPQCTDHSRAQPWPHP